MISYISKDAGEVVPIEEHGVFSGDECKLTTQREGTVMPDPSSMYMVTARDFDSINRVQQLPPATYLCNCGASHAFM
jgi:hypothetical protein